MLDDTKKTSIEVATQVLDEVVEELIKLSPEEINDFLKTIENKNLANYFEKEIYSKLTKGEQNGKMDS